MKSYADAHCDTVVKAMEAGENMLEFSGQLNLENLLPMERQCRFLPFGWNRSTIPLPCDRP